MPLVVVRWHRNLKLTTLFCGTKEDKRQSLKNASLFFFFLFKAPSPQGCIHLSSYISHTYRSCASSTALIATLPSTPAVAQHLPPGATPTARVWYFKGCSTVRANTVGLRRSTTWMTSAVPMTSVGPAASMAYTRSAHTSVATGLPAAAARMSQNLTVRSHEPVAMSDAAAALALLLLPLLLGRAMRRTALMVCACVPRMVGCAVVVSMRWTA